MVYFDRQVIGLYDNYFKNLHVETQIQCALHAENRSTTDSIHASVEQPIAPFFAEQNPKTHPSNNHRLMPRNDKTPAQKILSQPAPRVTGAQ